MVVVVEGRMAVAGEAACWAARLRRLRAEARPRPPDLDLDDDLDDVLVVVVVGPTALLLLRTLGCSCRRWGGTVVFLAFIFCCCCLALDLVRGLVLVPLPPFFFVLLPPPLLLAVLGWAFSSPPIPAPPAEAEARRPRTSRLRRLGGLALIEAAGAVTEVVAKVEEEVEVTVRRLVIIWMGISDALLGASDLALSLAFSISSAVGLVPPVVFLARRRPSPM